MASTVLRDSSLAFTNIKTRYLLSRFCSLSSPSSLFLNSTKNLCAHESRCLSVSRYSLIITSEHQSSSSLVPSGDHPPSSKEEAIRQARRSLSTALSKPLNNPRLAGKLKKQRQPRLRVEIPVSENSSQSIMSLVAGIFVGLPLKRKGSPARTLVLWSDAEAQIEAIRAFRSDDTARHEVLGSVDGESLAWGDVAVVVSPRSNQLDELETLCIGFEPKPVVMMNPEWAYEQEADLGAFVSSFDVVYSFMGLEVKGLLSKRRGVVFRYAKDGIPTSGGWEVLMEEEGGGGIGELRVVSRFKKRPSVVEVETVLYNLMAANSPVTKSVKFMKDMVSMATGLVSKKTN